VTRNNVAELVRLNVFVSRWACAIFVSEELELYTFGVSCWALAFLRSCGRGEMLYSARAVDAGCFVSRRANKVFC
jgi:hypothetical protein